MTDFPTPGEPGGVPDVWGQQFIDAIKERIGRPINEGAKTNDFRGVTGLPAGWSLSGGYVSGDLDFSEGSLGVRAPRANAYIYRALPAGDFTATMKSVQYSAGGTMFGLLAVDSTGAGVGLTCYTAPDALLLGQLAGGSYAGAFAEGDSMHAAFVNSGTPVWYRLRRSGTSFYGAMSGDGKHWSPEVGPQTPGSAVPDRIGFGSFFSTPGAFYIDWLDVR